MSKVYVINSYNNPIQSAAKYGQIEVITTGIINPFSIDRLAWSIAPKLAEFTSDDYLLLTGPGSGYILAATILLKDHDQIKCLRYETTTRAYVEVVITKDQIRDIWMTVTPSIPQTPGRIFVLNYSGHSIEPALSLSKLAKDEKLIVLTVGNIDQFNVDKMLASVSVPLLSFVQGDMLLLSGPAILHVMAATALWLLQQPFSILIYNPKFRQYSKREIDPRHIADIVQMAGDEKAIA
jgi:hypothetical protein